MNVEVQAHHGPGAQVKCLRCTKVAYADPDQLDGIAEMICPACQLRVKVDLRDQMKAL